MFKLKKIDTESKGYRAIRGGISFVASAGSGWTFEAMSIPWVAAIFEKHRFMRYVSYLGVIPLALKAAEVGDELTKKSIDDCVFLWNVLADKVNGEEDVEYAVEPERIDECTTKKFYRGIQIPDKNSPESADAAFVQELVNQFKLFEFGNEEGAKSVAERMYRYVHRYGACSVMDIFFTRGLMQETMPEEVRNILSLYGWDKDNINTVGVEQIGEDEWFVDAVNIKRIDNSLVLLYNQNKED